MKLEGRLHDIASGKSGLPKPTVVAYRNRWRREGYELPEIDWSDVPNSDSRPRATNDRSSGPPVGPGTELKRWLSATFGWPSCGFCRELAAEMDEWGVSGCREHLEEITDRICDHTRTLRESLEAEGKEPTKTQELFAKSPEIFKRPAIRMGVVRAINVTEQRLLRLGESVAVVIPCHNYARYLGECIESVLAQTARPREIVVVDDSSDDDPQVPDGVRLIRIDAGHVTDARQAGLDATMAKYICFLDADDTIGRDYLERAIEILDEDWRTAVVYSDTFDFGDSNDRTQHPARVTRENIDRVNRIHAGSVVRRAAIEITDGFSIARGDQSHADWHLWRKILDHGWTARKSPAVYNYRKHSAAMMNGPDVPWYDAQAAASETVSVLIPLSGRNTEVLHWLENQTWPHHQVELVIGDTSQDEVFSSLVRQWIARCDYPDVRHVQFAAGEQGLADRERKDDRETQRQVTQAMLRIWRKLTRGLTSRYTLTLEDDISAPNDVIERLLRSVEPSIDVVCAPYLSRYEPHYVVRERNGKSPRGRRKGLKRIESCGFGCMLVRSIHLRNHVWDDPEGKWYDPWFCTSNNLNVWCDWSIEVQHGLPALKMPDSAHPENGQHVGAEGVSAGV